MTLDEKTGELAKRASDAYEIVSAARTAFNAVLKSGGTEAEAYFAANNTIQLWQKKIIGSAQREK